MRSITFWILMYDSVSTPAPSSAFVLVEAYNPGFLTAAAGLLALVGNLLLLMSPR